MGVLAWIANMNWRASPAPPIIPIHLALLCFAVLQRTTSMAGRHRSQQATVAQRQMTFAVIGGNSSNDCPSS